MATYGTFVDGVSLKSSEFNDFLVWKTFSFSIRQGAISLTSASTFAKYAQVNKLVFFTASGTVQAVGTANTAVEFVLPVTAAASTQTVIGSAFIKDNDTGGGTSDIIRLVPVMSSTTRVKFLADDSTSTTIYLGQTDGPTFQFGLNDNFGIFGVYEAA
jgi:hypothetical protein